MSAIVAAGTSRLGSVRTPEVTLPEARLERGADEPSTGADLSGLLAAARYGEELEGLIIEAGDDDRIPW